MGLLMPLGVVLAVVGMAGAATSCYQNDGSGEARHTDMQLTQPVGPGAAVVLAPLSGLALAAGLVFMGIGIGHWKRPVSSEVRPANPWSDQPGAHGGPPKGLV